MFCALRTVRPGSCIGRRRSIIKARSASLSCSSRPRLLPMTSGPPSGPWRLSPPLGMCLENCSPPSKLRRRLARIGSLLSRDSRNAKRRPSWPRENMRKKKKKRIIEVDPVVKRMEDLFTLRLSHRGNGICEPLLEISCVSRVCL